MNNLEPRAKIGDVVIVRSTNNRVFQGIVIWAEILRGNSVVDGSEVANWFYEVSHNTDANGARYKDILKNLTTGKEYGNE